MINELKEQRGRLITQANEILTSAAGKMNAEQSAKFDALYAEADVVGGNIERAERAAKSEAELRSSVVPPIAQIGTEKAVANVEGQKSAFLSYLRNGKFGISAEEKRALSDTTGSQGGFLIPQGFSNKLEIATKWYGGMRQAASSFKTATGNTLPWPTNNDTTNAGGLLSAMTTPGTVSEQDTTFGVVTFNAYTLSSFYVAVPNELLQDSYFDLVSFLSGRFNERLGRAENTLFTTGTGTNQPGGIVTGATVGVTAATGGTTSITYNNLVDTVTSVDISYRNGAHFMFHDQTLSVIRKIVDGFGHPLFNPSVNDSMPKQILGYDYIINNDFATVAANAKTIAFGALDKYMIRDVEGIEVKRLDEIAAFQNQTVYLAFARVDGHLLD